VEHNTQIHKPGDPIDPGFYKPYPSQVDRSNYVWRVVQSHGYEKGVRRDFSSSEDAREYFQRLADEIDAVGQFNDRVILYRIRWYGGRRYQDAVKFAIKSPRGLLTRSTTLGPRTWQEAEHAIEKTRKWGRKGYQRQKVRRAHIRKLAAELGQ